MKVIIAGSRTIHKLSYVIDAVAESNFDLTEIVCGLADGVDRLGEVYGIRENIRVREFPANWAKFGLGAGLVRNKQMAEYADALIAVWDGSSRGTLDMITQMRELGKPVYVKVV